MTTPTMYRTLSDEKALKTPYKYRYHGITWYAGKANERTHSAQDTVFSMTSALDAVVKKLVADGVQSNGMPKDLHLWGTIATLMLPRLLNKDLHLQELLLLDRQTKVYVDVDGTAETMHLRERVLSALREVFPNGKIRRHGYATADKFSDHYVVSNRTFPFTSTSIRDMKFFFQEFRNAFGFPDNMIDVTVYSMHRPMKAVNQSKPRGVQSRVIKLNDDDDQLGKHLIQSNFDDDATDAMDDILAWYVSRGLNIPSAEPMVYVEPPKAKGGKAPKQRGKYVHKDIDFDGNLVAADFNYHTATSRERINAIPCDANTSHFLTLFVMHYAKHYGDMTFGEFWQWAAQKDASQTRRNKWSAEWTHRSPKAPYEQRMRDMYERAAIRSNRDFFDRPEFKNLKAMFAYEPNIVTAPYINEPHPETGAVAPLVFPQHKHMFICATTGAGKSQYIYDLVERCRTQRVLVIAPNVALINDLCARFSKASIPFVQYSDYRGKDADLREQRRIICTPNSVHKLGGLFFDLVVVDECETVWSGLANREFHGDNFERNIEALRQLRIDAEKCIDMDALLSKRSITQVTDGRPPLIVANTKTSDKVIRFVESVRMSYEQQHFCTVVLEALRLGKKVFFFVPKRKDVQWFADVVAAAFGWKIGTEIKCYHSETPKTDMQNVEMIWGDDIVRLVVSNTTIGVGVNFNTADKFDKVFGIYEPWLPVNSFIQALNRVRHPRDKIIDVLVMHKSGNQHRGTFVESVGRGDKEADYQLAKMIQELSQSERTTRHAEIVVETKKILKLLAERNGMTVVEGEREEYGYPNLDGLRLTDDWDNIEAIEPPDEATRLTQQGTVPYLTILGWQKYWVMEWVNTHFRQAEDLETLYRRAWGDRGSNWRIIQMWKRLYEKKSIPTTDETCTDLLQFFKANKDWQRRIGTPMNHIVRDVIDHLGLTFEGEYDNNLVLPVELRRRIKAEFKVPYARDSTKDAKLVAQLINGYFSGAYPMDIPYKHGELISFDTKNVLALCVKAARAEKWQLEPDVDSSVASSSGTNPA